MCLYKNSVPFLGDSHFFVVTLLFYHTDASVLTPELLIPVNQCALGFVLEHLKLECLCVNVNTKCHPQSHSNNGEGPRFERSMILLTFP